MAFDPQVHAYDKDGFIVHKTLGHKIGIDNVPVHSESTEWPKWVAVHGSHILGGVAPEFKETFRARDGSLTVLVHDAAEEAKAMAEKVIVVAEPAEHHED